ncbi:hypothetical protein [Arthrobacter sp. R4-81]
MRQPELDDTFSDALRAELVSRVQKTASRPERRARPWAAVGVAAGVLLLGGIGAGAAGLFAPPGQEQASPQSVVLASYKPEDTLAAFSAQTPEKAPGQIIGQVQDSGRLPTTEALASVSGVVVKGTVAGIREGRTDTNALGSIVVVVDIENVVQGAIPEGNDGRVYVELPAIGHPHPSDYAKALPDGAVVVAYLVAAPNSISPAGLPDGQALLVPAGPQGFALQVGDHDIVWPLTGAREPGEITETLPGGTLVG